jgi:two-component system, OmpR family, phosphate regulon sensor histidine kinase PhoR
MRVDSQLLTGERKMRTIEGFVATSPMQDQTPGAFAAERFQTALIGMMGHDLRQSLQIISGTYALLRARPNAMPQPTWLDRGERAVERLTEQLNRLVDAFYLAERASGLQVSSVALAPLFWRLRSESEGTALQRGIDLRTHATKAEVLSNPLLLECVLRNLLTNAIKYTEPGGCVLVGCRRKGPEIRIDVYDTGIGIPEDRLPRIFDTFTRLTPEYCDGLGIGLSIVRRALEVLGHRIEVRSIMGEGSLFSIYLPAAMATNVS